MFKNKSRIDLNDDVLAILLKLADGNPGAIDVMSRLVQSAEKIDPDSIFKGLGPLLSLDNMGIYGSEIWVLFKDVCGSSILNMMTLFRGAQLGIVDMGRVTAAARGDKQDFVFSDILDLVQEELPEFGKEGK